MSIPKPTTTAMLQELTRGLPAGEGRVVTKKAHGRICRALGELVTSENVGAMAVEVARIAEVSDVYVSVCSIDADRFAQVVARGGRARGGRSDAASVTHLVSDIDIAGVGHAGGKSLPPDLDAVGLILAELPTASFVVHSGGGVHAWWRLAEPLSVEDGEALLDDWCRTVAKRAEEVGGWSIDEGIGEPARILRISGTYNYKEVERRYVGLTDDSGIPAHESMPVYSADVLEGLCDPLRQEKRKRDRPLAECTRAPRPARATKGGDLNILECLDRLDWSDIWPPGWTFIGNATVSGESVERWLRPGDPSSEHSATCWPSGGCRLWSDAVSGLPSGDYSKADIGAWALGLSLNQFASELATAGNRGRRQLVGLGGIR